MGLLTKMHLYVLSNDVPMHSKIWIFDVDSSVMDNFRPPIVGCEVVLAFKKKNSIQQCVLLINGAYEFIVDLPWHALLSVQNQC